MVANPPTESLYTAAQIADKLGLTKRRVRQLLEAGNPVEVSAGANRVSKVFSIQSLPEDLRGRLMAKAREDGFRNGEELLNARLSPWQLVIDGRPAALSEIDERHVTRAILRRSALLPILAKIQTDPLNEADLQDLRKRAANQLQTSDRHIRRLVSRTLERDRGFKDFDRVEIYLDENISRQDERARGGEASGAKLPEEFSDIIRSLEDPANPTSDDKLALWEGIVSHYRECEARHPGKRDLRTNFLQFLENVWKAVPRISKNLAAFERAFYRKLQQPNLEDKRRLASGRFRRPEFAQDREVITSLAVQHGGKESLAQREAIKRGLLSREYCDYYNLDFRHNKSYVPRTIRGDVTAEVNAMEDIHRGPRQHKLNRFHISRDWSDTIAGDYFSADDVTWPVYSVTKNDDDEWIVVRCECLVMIDLRSGYVLDFLMIPGKYNSRHIRGLQLSVHDKVGLPSKGFYFENGVWRARFVAGTHTKKENVHWRDTQRGLEDLGLALEVRHAQLPRAKTIEGLFGILQNRMESEPGYVGRNEMLEKFERTQKVLRLASKDLVSAIRKLYTLEEWCARLNTIFTEYNHETQNGKMLPGMSPFEKWTADTSARPLRVLPPECRYHLATHKRRTRVTKKGINLTMNGNRDFWYWNAEVAKLEGREVVTRFNADFPQIITVLDLDERNPFCVEQKTLPAMTATKEQASRIYRVQAESLAVQKNRYGQIKHGFINQISRDTEFAREDFKTGEFIEGNEKAVKERQQKGNRQLGRASVIAAELGQRLPANVDNPDRMVRSLELEREAERELEQQGNAEHRRVTL